MTKQLHAIALRQWGRVCTLLDVMVNGVGVRNDCAELGSWLPIHDAARELGVLEILAYRLMSEGKLRSRRQDDGLIEIWVADTDPLTQGPTRPSDAGCDGRYLVLAERLASAVHYQVEVLTNSLAAAYDRNTQLTRENGALTERLEGVERELKALRAVQDRLHAAEATNAQLTRLMSTWVDGQARAKRWGWSWLPGVSILLLMLLLLLPVVALLRPIIAVWRPVRCEDTASQLQLTALLAHEGATDDAGTLLGGVKGGNQHPGAPCLGAAARSPSCNGHFAIIKVGPAARQPASR